MNTPDRELYFPQCPDSIKPYHGQKFDTLPQAQEFYKKYATACGFETRLSAIHRSSDGTITSRYIVCRRQGVWQKAKGSIMQANESKAKKRKTTSCKIACMARAVFKLSTGGRYKITEFNEDHTHSMVPVDTRNLMHSNRNVDEFQQRLIISGIKANIGLMRTFRLAKEILGSYDDVGCTGNDFKNFARDLKELGNGFKFFHHVDEDNKLCRQIWADEISIKNYKLFGDAVSFDATYCTNRYKMIFTPFTGRDNHGKCISFGA
ncbi:protein FAR1-RELATED SEQUENCE 5-like [Salvia miltiorrhiza]|uniref:protein FAR1-RELATED SEQUENCE 5-like n=1 Tax=Salvia miltiorrhiza TaxID=226208 RepID=UPI0025ABC58E|nr:protein FAR1-RELATED SEQUENCE 5-like [Salvia miltiorrhiza]